MKPNLHPQYITDESGHRVSVVLPCAEYAELLEDIEDLAAVAERRAEPTISLDDLEAKLREEGVL